MFTGIDFITAILILSGILTGIVRGFVGNLIDLLGISVGIILASVVYEAPVSLFRKFGMSESVVDLIWFLISAIFLSFTIILLFELLRKRVDIKHIIDRIFGVFTGALIGLILTGMVYITVSGSYNAAKNLQESKFPRHIIKYIPKIYEKLDRKGIVLPKMFFLTDSYNDEFNPEFKKIKFVKINFTKFDNSTCIKCNGKVKFDGYFPVIGTAVIPKFTCKNCGRTSDGCQVFEVFHFLYHQCPIDLAKKGKRFDCPRFPNHEWITPQGPCPVDNKELPIWDWYPPEKY